MMTTALAALCLLMPPQTAYKAEMPWPMVATPQFVINGIDATGNAQLVHAKVAEKAGTTSIGAPRTFSAPAGNAASLALPPGTSPWKTLEIAFTTSSDGPLAKFDGIELAVKGGSLWFVKDGNSIKVAPLVAGDLNDVHVVTHFDSLLAYVNGVRGAGSVLYSKALTPIEVGIEPWKGTIVGIAGYSRVLSVDEIFANFKAAKSMSKALFADTAKVTVEGELTAFTPVPELERIRPYRSALLAEEYKVVRIVSGRMSSIKPGMKIRIFRYGIKAGEKTAVKDIKVGGHDQMLIQPYESDVKFSREFQVDALDPDITIPLFVDVTPEK